MRRIALVTLAGLGICLALVAFASRPVRAQDILGMSLRPTGVMPAGTSAGAVDIVGQDGGGYLVSVDLSGVADSLASSDYAGDTLVVWAVDTEGTTHRLGALSEQHVLEDAPADYLIARIFVTSEASAEAAAPSGESLFQATLRNVPQAETTATPAAEEGEGEGEEAAAGQAPSTPEPTKAANPQDLPRTGALDHGPLPIVALAMLALLGFAAAGAAFKAV
jgi:hypothetical protein